MFSDAIVHTALSSIAGMYLLGDGPTGAKPFGVYRPASVPADLVPQQVHIGARPPLVVTSPQPTPLGEFLAVEDPRNPDPTGRSSPPSMRRWASSSEPDPATRAPTPT